MTTIIKTVAVTSCLFFVVGTVVPASERTGTVRNVCGAVLPGTIVSVANQSGADTCEPRVIDLRLERR
jgi:hypothetical protein